MKRKNVTILALMLALIATGCGSISGSTASAPKSIGPLNQNYTNAISPSEQLIVGVFKLESTNQAINSQQASQLIPLWETYQILMTSDTAAQEEIDATLTQIEETLTTKQVQAIAKMKLTTQDTADIQQQQGIVSSGTSKTSASSVSAGQGGGGFPGEGDIVGLGPAPVVATSSAKTNTASQPSATNTDLINAVIKFLQTKVIS